MEPKPSNERKLQCLIPLPIRFQVDPLILNSFRGGSVVVGFLFIVTPIVGVCNCSIFYCMLLYVHSSLAIILIGKRELVALLNLSPWCLVMVEWLFLAVPWGCLWFVIVVFPDHINLLFFLPNIRDVFYTHQKHMQLCTVIKTDHAYA